jgi:hypothetical protein
MSIQKSMTAVALACVVLATATLGAGRAEAALTYNGLDSINGSSAGGLGRQGDKASGAAAADVGALRVETIRLRDGRVLVRQP